MDDKEKLCMKLDGACKTYKILDGFLKNELFIVDNNNTKHSTEKAIIISSLAREFIFEAARVYRIVDRAHQNIGIERDDRKMLLSSLKNIVRTRGINEHWCDPKGVKEQPKEYASGAFSVDDTSMIILNDKIIFGNLNLKDVYEKLNQMNDKYGWGSDRYRNNNMNGR